MATARTFKFSEGINLNLGNKNINIIIGYARAFDLESKVKTHKNLKLIELVCLGMLLQCTNYKRSLSRDSESKVNKTDKCCQYCAA